MHRYEELAVKYAELAIEHSKRKSFSNSSIKNEEFNDSSGGQLERAIVESKIAEVYALLFYTHDSRPQLENK